MQKLQFEIAKKGARKVQIPDAIGVGELASRMKKTGTEVVKALIKNGVMASLSDIIELRTPPRSLVAMELGCKVEHEVVVTVEDASDRRPRRQAGGAGAARPGSRGHGVTSNHGQDQPAGTTSARPTLPPEMAGGITQHIGAYNRQRQGQPGHLSWTPPGHEAFTSMRARGRVRHGHQPSWSLRPTTASCPRP